MSRSLKTVKSNPLAGRIKKVMQTDEDVGKIAQGAPVLMSRAMELFLNKLCEGTAAIATGVHARTATPSHLKAFVTSNGKMDFLSEKFASVPDFNDEDATPAKKQRAETGLASSPSGNQLLPDSPPAGGRAARGRGRGRSRGRGSTRVSANDSRPVQFKDEQQGDPAAQSMLNPMDTQPSVKSEQNSGEKLVQADPTASDAATIASHHSDQAAEGTSQDNPASPVQVLSTAPLHDCALPNMAEPQQSMPAVDAPSLQPSAQALAQPLAASSTISAADLTSFAKHSSVLAEEDDYDADE